MSRICNANVDLFKGRKVEIYPTEEQKEKISVLIDIYRTVFNIGLDIQNKNYESGNKYIQCYNMFKIFSDLRNNNEEYTWLNAVQQSTIRQSLFDLDNAFKRFFNKISKYPKFKSKKNAKKSFTVRSNRCYIHGKYIRIPELGMVNAKNHHIPENVNLYNTTITFDGYRYWFSCKVETPRIDMSEVPKSNILGIDVGIRTMIATSEGEFYKYSDVTKYEKRLKRLQRRLSKHYKKYQLESDRTKIKYEDIPKSKNMQKLSEKAYKTSRKIINKLHNDINTATKKIVSKNPKLIVIEDLNTTKILQSQKWIRKYTKHVLFYEIRRQIEYKAKDRNIPVLIADSNFASSKICSNCGNIRNIGSNHTYKCSICGLKIDRDLNAAYNLRNLGYQSIQLT